MLIDVPCDAHLILFRVQSFSTIEEPRAVIGSFGQAAKGRAEGDLSCSARCNEPTSQENQSRFTSYFGDSGVRKLILIGSMSCVFARSRQLLMGGREIIVYDREILDGVPFAHREAI